MPKSKAESDLEAETAAQEKAAVTAEKSAESYAEMTPEEQFDARRKARANFKAPKKEYKGLAPGDYAGNMGGEETILTVPSDGVVSTDDGAVQGYLENVLGREGTLVE